jgi:predicted DNA-binding transcriptional regulator AlpA
MSRLGTLRDAAEECSVQPNTMRQYSHKYETFPKPQEIDSIGRGIAWDLDEIYAWHARVGVTLREAASALGLSHSTLRNYSQRYNDFPKPVRTNVRGHGTSWDLDELRAWYDGKPKVHTGQHYSDRTETGRKASRTRRINLGLDPDPPPKTTARRRPRTKRSGDQMTTEPVKKAVSRLCMGGCGELVKPGERVFGVKNRPGRYVHETCGLRMKAEKREAS